MAEQEVQAAINGAQTLLPLDLPAPPIYSKSNPADTPVMTLALTSSSDSVDASSGSSRHTASAEDLAIAGRRIGDTVVARSLPFAFRRILPRFHLRYHLEDCGPRFSKLVLTSPGNFDGPSQSYQIDANDRSH